MVESVLKELDRFGAQRFEALTAGGVEPCGFGWVDKRFGFLGDVLKSGDIQQVVDAGVTCAIISVELTVKEQREHHSVERSRHHKLRIGQQVEKFCRSYGVDNL